MTTYVFANNVNTTLASAASNTATTLTLASSANLPTLSAGQIMPLTLNDAATGAVYEIVYVTAISGATLTVTRAQEGTGAQNWSVGDYAFCTATAGTTAASTGNPSNVFQVGAATAAADAVNLGQFGATQATSGYQELPNGTILQWGTVTTSASADVAATFPIPFPNAAFQVLVSAVNSGTGAFGGYNSLSASGFNANGWTATGTRAVVTLSYLAIGH